GHPGPARAAGRRGTAQGTGRRARPGPGAHHRRPGVLRRRVLRRHRDHRRRADGRGQVQGRRRDHALAGDALAVWHHPAHRERAPAVEAARLLVGQLRLKRRNRRFLGGVRTASSPPRTSALTSITGVSALAGGVLPRLRPSTMCPLTITDTPSGTISRRRPPNTVAYTWTRLACRMACMKSTS